MGLLPPRGVGPGTAVGRAFGTIGHAFDRTRNGRPSTSPSRLTQQFEQGWRGEMLVRRLHAESQHDCRRRRAGPHARPAARPARRARRVRAVPASRRWRAAPRALRILRPGRPAAPEDGWHCAGRRGFRQLVRPATHRWRRELDGQRCGPCARPEHRAATARRGACLRCRSERTRACATRPFRSRHAGSAPAADRAAQ